MVRSFVILLAILVAGACSGGGSSPVPIPPPPGPGEPAFGLTQRTQVQGLTFPINPPPPAGIQIVEVFRNLNFNQLVQLTYAPDGSDRIFVVTLEGRIHVFPNQDNVTNSTVFLNLTVLQGGEQGLLGLAFDPDYANNGHFYVHYSAAGPRRSVISRFTVSAGDPDLANVTSEVVLLEVNQPASNHNAGMLAFGPDDMLYISMGDGGGGGDTYGNGQNTGTLLGSMLRIDPNGSTPPYDIPADNPFVGNAGVLDEIYAYGLRNPWRFSFDRSTGDLWLGDVGQGSREEIDIIVSGGNYGWPVYEGNNAFNGGQPASNFDAPVTDYGRSQGSTVIGGNVYRGTRSPSLAGTYFYGDYGSGSVWALTWDGNSVTSNSVVGNIGGLASFGEDQAGEVYAATLGGNIYRFEASGGGPPVPPPATLSATGLFTNTTNLVPAPGLIEYEVASPLWSDNAVKRRWIALPGNNRIDFSANGPWTFPLGTILVKHFELELAPGSMQRLETRVLVLESSGWAGYLYKWNFLMTDADLISGADTETYTVQDPTAPGGQRQQTWNFPSRAQCLICHTAAAGRVLGIKTRQLNIDFDYPNATDNQLRSWNNIQLFTTDIGDNTGYDVMPDPADTSATLPGRARSYLDANCAQCHRPGGTALGNIDFRWTVPLANMNIVDVRPTQGDLGLVDAFRIKSGVKESSTLWERIHRLDNTRMPPLASNLVDDPADMLLGTWIDLGPADK